MPASFRDRNLDLTKNQLSVQLSAGLGD